MAGSSDRLSEQLRAVLTLAEEEAHRCGHNYVGTEHLLLGLTLEEDAVAARILRRLGMDVAHVQDGVETLIRSFTPGGAWTGLTPRSENLVRLAAEEADQLHHGAAGSEHLLLALVREGQGVAAGVLACLGLDDADRLRQGLLEEIGAPRI